ncbi:methyl-accepting chemotaxis protein [Terasakiella sp. A23]|uniref:methyl-accepting chemotaxis protein n=1 Tax=Terasakiella sp. FCG-A23 TaxID=3080561 RepID=UPI0029554D39|nr:methyl-accepting chemotaxis protein [Terasakiella sp. A23]MDV7338197.1 methyl-accepting chemotaxis protein [Terasakiella sp. A23]
MQWFSKSILWKIVLPIPVTALIAVLLMAFVVPGMMRDNAIENAVDSATQTVTQFKAIRGYYTKNIIKKVLANGGVHPSITHKDEADAIPLPATFVHDMSDILSENDTKVKLYSAYPFPNRADRKLDDFQQEAWDKINANPDQKFVRAEERDGKTVVRVAIADFMVADACVNCHNSHPDTPKDDWKMNDVRGILEVDTNIEAAVMRGEDMSTTMVVFSVLIASILTGVAMVSAKSVSSGVSNMTRIMHDFADGAKEVDVPKIDREDEIGLMAKSMQIFKENRARRQADAQAAKEREARLVQERKNQTEQIANDFENSVGSIADNLEGFTQSLQTSADSMNRVSDNAQAQTSEVANMADQATRNAETVAAAAEELSASIGSITEQVAHASSVATGAQDQVTHTNDKIRQLAQAVTEIGEVVQMITGIAEQTNLLALNATIESARAGEAGKGFAVVAGEVKNLANQTARATQDIVDQINNIQEATDESVEAMEGVARVITEINETSAAIAASVEQQGAATQEISVNAQEAAAGTGQVSSTIASVNEAAVEVGQASDSLTSSVDELNKLSSTLSNEVDAFLQHIRKE